MLALAGLTAVAGTASPIARHPTGIAVAKIGLGTVTSEPEWISCGTTCKVAIPEGEVVHLTATPEPGQTFVRWNGCEPTNQSTCRIEIYDLECVVAEFTGGGVTSTPNCTAAVSGASPSPAAPAGDHPPLGSRCTISGTPRSDVLRGTAADDVICGKGGNDVIYGRGGNDLVLGGAGNDKLLGQAGGDHLTGGPGNDVLVGGGGEDELFGSRGSDLLRSRDGLVDLVNGGPGRDRARVDLTDLVRSIERRL